MPATAPMEEPLPESSTSAASTFKEKRFSVPRQLSERRVTIRPYESFREKHENKNLVSFGYAALSTEGNYRNEETGISCDDSRRISSPSVFSIYGDTPGPSTICEQPIGAQADVYISSLGDKTLHQIKKFLESSPPADNQYFMWVKDIKTNKITVISIKTFENHMKSDKRVRRVKWRHLSSERISIYRYSIPAITYEKSKACSDCVYRHKKLCLLAIWLSFVLFLCVIVVLGSLQPEERSHPFLHYRANYSIVSATAFSKTANFL